MEQCPDFERATRYFERKGYASGSKKHVFLDEDMMIRSILDGLGALLQVQHKKRTLGRTAKSKVFLGALAAIAVTSLDDMDMSGEGNIVSNFVTCCFPGNVERLGRTLGADRDWMPWLWVGFLKDLKGVRYDDLTTDHRGDQGRRASNSKSNASGRVVESLMVKAATAGHFAAAARQPLMPVIERFLMAKNESSTNADDENGNDFVRRLDASGRLPLHYAALYSESIAIIELLLASFPEAARARDNILGRTPLHMLAERSHFDGQYAMIRCLANADIDVVMMVDKSGNTPLHASCRSEGKGRELIIEYLMNLHRDSVYEQNKCGRLPLHLACEVDDESAIVVANLLLSVFPEGAKMADRDGMLPLHFAAASCNVTVVCKLFDMYPDAARQNIEYYGTPLHQTACQTESGKQIILKLSTEYPEAACLPAKGTSWLPLHAAADLGNVMSICELYKLNPEAVKHKDAEGSLPLHILLSNKDPVMYDFNPLSEEAAALRFLLAKYPEAVGVTHGLDDELLPVVLEPQEVPPEINSIPVRDTAYDISVREGLNSYVQRLLLRARPELHPEELHRLNYAERRVAMFLAFSAQYASSLSEGRGERGGGGGGGQFTSTYRRFVEEGHIDVLKHVVAYL